MSEEEVKDEKSVRLMLGYLCIATEAEASLVRKVEILDRFELSGPEIAQICGCPVGSVHTARMKRKKRTHGTTS